MKNLLSTKVLVPLATALAAGAVAVGSGATFTSQSDNSISSVTSGTLRQSNSKDNAAIFSLSDIKPGDTVNGSLTITNTGSLPADFGLTEVSSTNGFTGSYLTMKVTNSTTGATVFDGTFGGLVDGARTALGTIQPSGTNTFVFSVSLAENAPNTQQGKTATAAYQWDSVQESGSTTAQ